MAYTVTVGDFEGPFDLLLKLIAQRRVDVYDVALADITDDYLAVVRTMDTLDLEATTEFLVIASTLVELKAARLLPTDEEPELDELAMDARDLLYARLLDFQVFSEAAAFLGGRLADQRGYIPREVALEERFVGSVPPVDVAASPDDLARFYADLLARQAERERPVDTSHLPPIPMTVGQASQQLLDRLVVAGGRGTFRSLTSAYTTRVEVAVAFLAVLELYKDEHIDVFQSTHFGDLVIESTEDGAADAGGADPATRRPLATHGAR
ncbi:MAG TPA: segregation/condensation protein A [Euzebyales bacterium]